MEQLTDEEFLRWLRRVIPDHLAVNNELTHDIATEYSDGFMSKNHVKQVQNAMGNLSSKPSNVATGDDLPPGSYLIADLDGAPQTGWGIWNVQENNGSKIITFIQTYSGKIYIKTVRPTEPYPYYPLGWSAIPRETLIWAGSATTINTEIKLNELQYRFDYLKILVANDGGKQVFEVPNESTVSVRMMNVYDNATITAGAVFSEITLTRKDNNTLKIHNNVSTGIFPNGSNSGINGTSNDLTVLSIWGISK